MSSIPWIDAVYVIHAKQGYEYHEKRLNSLFHSLNIPFKYITDGDVSNFTDELLNKYFGKELIASQAKGSLSCTLNHIMAYERMCRDGNRYALIFENDPFFLVNFTKWMNTIGNEASPLLDEGAIISLENSTLRFPSYFQVKKGKHIYHASCGRMAGAYLIGIKAASRIIKDIGTNKCNFIIDLWHNDLIEQGVINMHWMHPPLVEQGSHNGLLQGPLSTKPKSMARRIAWQAQKSSKYYLGRLMNNKRIIE